MRTPLAIIGVLLAILVPVGFATESGSEPEVAPSADVATIARRVERLRELRFETLPKPLRVDAEQAQREGLADLDRGYPAAAREADERLYTMLGLLPEGTDLRDVSASIFGEGVAGYYDPRDGRLRVVEGAGTSNRVVDEMIIAHELTHALEDQRHTLDRPVADAVDDRGYAYRALVEGTATTVMYAYVARHFGREEAFGGLLGSAFASGTGPGLPPFIGAGLVFPYVQGEAFVAELRRRGGWRLVNVALRDRPPASTEQVLHPDKWLRVEQPDRVELPPQRGWSRVTGGTFGEWQTGQLLGQPAAAEGWGGDRYALLRRGDEHMVVIRWRWDDLAAARRATEALRGALPKARVTADGVITTLVVT